MAIQRKVWVISLPPKLEKEAAQLVKKEEKTKESAVSTGPTGAVVGAPFGNAKKWGWLVTLLIIIIGLILYNKLRKKTKRNSKG